MFLKISQNSQENTCARVSFLNKIVGQDTHREKAPSNKTPALTKSTNMGIWVVGTSNQLFKGGS